MDTMRCTKCMGDMSVESGRCPRCGYVQNSTPQPPNALKRNTILHGRYLVGNVIGQGGFGITYVGWDVTLEMKVAIKEYYPSGLASRSNSFSNQIQWDMSENDAGQRMVGMERFLKEARRMAKLDSVPAIVRVRDAFQENETAYIIMDFVEGVTLKSYLMEHGVLGYEGCMALLSQIIDSLAVIHDQGFIHRDISPDNIMIQPDGTARLLDMGAAVDMKANAGKVSMAVVKRNFSAPEQYMESMPLGSWTDVYAMAATIYYAMTGQLVPEVMERQIKKTPVVFDPIWPIPSHVVLALNDALAIDAGQRIRDMRELKRRLTMVVNPEPVQTYGGGSVRTPEFSQTAAANQLAQEEKPVKTLMVILSVLGVGILCTILTLLLQTQTNGLWSMWLVGICGGAVVFNRYGKNSRKGTIGLCVCIATSLLMGWIAVIPMVLLYLNLPEYRKKRKTGQAVSMKQKVVLGISIAWLGIMLILTILGAAFIAMESVGSGTGGRGMESDQTTIQTTEAETQPETQPEMQEETENELDIPSDWIEGDYGFFTQNDDGTYTLTCALDNSAWTVMPSEFQGKPVTAVDNYAFAYNVSTEQIHIANTVKTLGEGVFDNCPNLKAVFIPSSVETVDYPLVTEIEPNSPRLCYFTSRTSKEIADLGWNEEWLGVGDWSWTSGIDYGDGTGTSGWFETDNGWHYLHNGFAAFGWYEIGEFTYCFDERSMAYTGWVLLEDGKSRNYFDEIDCYMVTGWREINGNWYYFDLEDGIMLTDTMTPDGYYVDADGIYHE